MFDLIETGLAIYGVYVLVGGPVTDKVTALGRKAWDFVAAKIRG